MYTHFDVPFAPQPPLHHPKAMMRFMAQTMPTDDANDAREQIAARLERLARRIREETDRCRDLDKVYAESLKFNVRVRSLLFDE